MSEKFDSQWIKKKCSAMWRGNRGFSQLTMQYSMAKLISPICASKHKQIYNGRPNTIIPFQPVYIVCTCGIKYLFILLSWEEDSTTIKMLMGCLVNHMPHADGTLEGGHWTKDWGNYYINTHTHTSAVTYQQTMQTSVQLLTDTSVRTHYTFTVGLTWSHPMPVT